MIEDQDKRDKEKITLEVTSSEKLEMCNALLLLAYGNLNADITSGIKSISHGLLHADLNLAKVALSAQTSCLDEYKASIEDIESILNPPQKPRGTKKAKKKTEKKASTKKRGVSK